jgi:hypothetical protein
MVWGDGISWKGWMTLLIGFGPRHAAAEAEGISRLNTSADLLLAASIAEVETALSLIAKRICLVERVRSLNSTVGTDVAKGHSMNAGVSGGRQLLATTIFIVSRDWCFVSA